MERSSSHGRPRLRQTTGYVRSVRLRARSVEETGCGAAPRIDSRPRRLTASFYSKNRGAGGVISDPAGPPGMRKISTRALFGEPVRIKEGIGDFSRLPPAAA